MQKSKIKIDKIIVLILIMIFALSPFTARKVKAQLFVPVWDPGNFSVNAHNDINTTSLFSKEFILDAVLYQVVNMIIEKLSAETIDWINGGFQGSPAYVADPQAYFLDVGNKAAGQFIFSEPHLNLLCSPIRAKIRLALTRAYLREPTWRCTLDDVQGNMDDFMSDFDRGGWDKFFQLTQNQQNNPIGAYLQGENEMFQKIESETNEKLKELDWGQGIKSFETCSKWGDPPIGYISTYPGCSLEPGPDGTPVSVCDDAPEPGQVCLEHKTATPGSVVQSQLNSVLGIGNERLAVANEINEIISALLNQLMKKVMGGVTGLAGLSKPDTSDGGSIFTNSLLTTVDGKVVDKNKEIETYIQGEQETLTGLTNYVADNPYDAYFCRNNPNTPECLPPTGNATDSNNPSGSISIIQAKDCQYIDESYLNMLPNGPETIVLCSGACQSDPNSCVAQ